MSELKVYRALEESSILRACSLAFLALCIGSIWAKVMPSASDGALFVMGLLLALYFPGRFAASAFSLRYSPEERLLVSLLAGMILSSLTYWVLGFVEQRHLLRPFIAVFSLGGAGLTLRDWLCRQTDAKEPRLYAWFWPGMLALYLLMLVTLLSFGYFDAFREGQDGAISVSNFPDDGLFHAGLVHELLKNIPPSSPLVSGHSLNYSYFLDVLAALFHDLFKLEVPHLLYVFLPLFFFGLVVLAICTAGSVVNRSCAAGLLCAFVVLFSGGMFNPIAGLIHFGWQGARWELVFHASTIVPLLFINPMLPAVALFYGALLCISRSFSSSGKGWAVMGGVFTAALVQYKIFGSAVILAGVSGAFVVYLVRQRHLPPLFPFLAVFFIATPFFFHHSLLKAEETQVVTRFQPGAPVLWTLGYLGLDSWAGILRGSFEGVNSILPAFLSAGLIAPLHVLGSMGIKLFALPSLIKGSFLSRSSEPFLLFMGWAFLAGVLGTYLFSLTPRDLPGAYNNSVWLYAFSLHVAALAVSGVLKSFAAGGNTAMRVLILLIPLLSGMVSTAQLFCWSKANKHVYDATAPVVSALKYLTAHTRPNSLILLDPSVRQGPEDSLFISGIAGRRVVLSGSYLDAYQAPAGEVAARRKSIGEFFRDPCTKEEALNLYGPDYVWTRQGATGGKWGETVDCKGFSLQRVFVAEEVDIYKVIHIE